MVREKFIVKLDNIIAAIMGITIFFCLTKCQIPYRIIPGTDFQIRQVFLSIIAAMYGPVTGGVVGLFGHFLSDALYYENISYGWIAADCIYGILIGYFFDDYKVLLGQFKKIEIFRFNMIQLIANAICWLIVAPFIDMTLFDEPVDKVVAQGFFAFISNFVLIFIIGTLVLLLISFCVNKKIEK